MQITYSKTAALSSNNKIDFFVQLVTTDASPAKLVVHRVSYFEMLKENENVFDSISRKVLQ